MNTALHPFKDYSISKKLGLLLSLFALISLANGLAFWHYHQRQDAPRVDAAGRNRMLSQRIGLLAERIVHGQEHVRQELSQAIELHHTSLQALKEGGVAPGIAQGKVLPPTAPALLPTLLEAETLWHTYQAQAEVILHTSLYTDTVRQVVIDSSGFAVARTVETQVINPTVRRALNFLEQNAALMLKKNNDLVKRYVQENREEGAWLQAIQLLLLVLNVVVIGIALHQVRTYVVAPLEMIRDVSQRLAVGDLSSVTHYASQDEVGQAISNINLMTHRLKDSVAFAHAVGQGSFDTDFQVAGEHDTLGNALVQMRSQLQQITQEDEKRNWAAAGLAQVNELLRSGQDDLKTLAQHVLAFIISYLEANQGACFVVNDDDRDHPYLELLALHAGGRPRQRKKRIEPAEGVAGQAWLEGDSIYLTEIPEDYLKITSGLGKANPRSILVVPFASNQRVVGVIEIASFREYQAHERDLISKMGESIAAVFSTVKINHETKRLLKNSQQQAEALQAQEEEMRQNMEELSATQEEMVRQGQEYQKVIETLKAR